ncbi:MAG TPA: LysM peptidoglycan-binding domain-containing protein [Chryseosolibacter sp.]
MIKLLIFFSFSLVVTTRAEVLTPMDSVGVETVNGKTFIIHKVDEKETLFAISRRYKVSVDAILEFNKDAEKGLEIGQIVKVPYTPKATLKQGEGVVHTVEAKETMFSISRKYGVTTDEIKQWNNLADNTLSIGQTLIIKKKTGGAVVVSTPPLTKKGVHTVGQQETIFSIARQYGITQQQLKDWNNLQTNELKIGQTLFVSQPERSVATIQKNEPTVQQEPVRENPVVKQEPATKNEPIVKKDPEPVKKEPDPARQTTSTTEQPVPTIRISESVKNGSETVQGGLAELIEGTEGNRKYLALHRTAPIGTILKVRNEMNNREVFVRVTGKLPDTALTDKVIIRISKSAYDRLGAIDQRFRVEVTYYK